MYHNFDQKMYNSGSDSHEFFKTDISGTAESAQQRNSMQKKEGRSSTTVTQEVPRFVPVVEFKEIIKEVPQIEVEYVEKVVEVPQIQYVDKFEEVEEIKEIEKQVAKIEVVDVPVEKVKYIGVKTEKIVEKVVPVQSKTEKRYFANPVVKDIPFVVPQFNDKEVPLIVSQTIVPEIEETNEEVEVEVAKYVPYLVPVDIYVPRPISVPVVKTASVTQDSKAVTKLTNEALQKLMVEMNPHLQELEKFNAYQTKVFQDTMEESKLCAKNNHVSPVPPLSAPIFTIEQQKAYKKEFNKDVEQIYPSSKGACNCYVDDQTGSSYNTGKKMSISSNYNTFINEPSNTRKNSQYSLNELNNVDSFKYANSNQYPTVSTNGYFSTNNTQKKNNQRSPSSRSENTPNSVIASKFEDSVKNFPFDSQQIKSSLIPKKNLSNFEASENNSHTVKESSAFVA